MSTPNTNETDGILHGLLKERHNLMLAAAIRGWEPKACSLEDFLIGATDGRVQLEHCQKYATMLDMELRDELICKALTLQAAFKQNPEACQTATGFVLDNTKSEDVRTIQAAAFLVFKGRYAYHFETDKDGTMYIVVDRRIPESIAIIPRGQ